MWRYQLECVIETTTSKGEDVLDKEATSHKTNNFQDCSRYQDHPVRTWYEVWQRVEWAQSSHQDVQKVDIVIATARIVIANVTTN